MARERPRAADRPSCARGTVLAWFDDDTGYNCGASNRAGGLVSEFNQHEYAAPATGAGRKAGYAEWIALGAVVAGSVGAIVGAARCARPAARATLANDEHLDPAMVTAPHGDKLHSAL
jgi:hypothetical protein